MISLDQVLLLQKKVETAVEKIRTLSARVTQLESENDALRRKCTELQNSLADKSGLVSSLEAEQSQIEETIRKALDQLDDVENAVLDSDSKTALQSEPAGQADFSFTEPAAEEAKAPGTQQEPVQEQNSQISAPVQPAEPEQTEASAPQSGSTSAAGDINGQFDIF